MRINIKVKNTQRYENAINEIGKFRTYYEQLIALTDPDYLQIKTDKFNLIFDETGIVDYNSISSAQSNYVIDNTSALNIIKTPKQSARLSVAQIIFIIYILGVLIFFSRIIILFHWILKTINKNQIEIYNSIKIIKLGKNLPPFSFMGYVFFNNNIYSTKKIEQILAHEKAHIKQYHSVDLLIAHAITILQWFNPFVWFLQKTIKTNHEYLADSNVVNHGYNLLDYQELLLNQFISIPSVQLVNNFNLISIKKRINMMNKTKSGLIAKFKAILIIPAALFAFILFANLTLNSPGKVLTNLSFFEIQNNMNQLKGMWNNTNDKTYGIKVLFEKSKFSVIDDKIILKEYPYQIQGNQILLSLPGNETIELKYEVVNEQLKIWWNEAEYSLYEKSEYNNTLDDYLSHLNVEIDLPVIKKYWLLQRQDLCIDVAMIGNQIYVNKKSTSYTDLKEALIREKNKINQLDQKLITIRVFADKNLSMEYMNKLNQSLREIGLLKIAHVGKVNDPKVSKLQVGYIGMTKKIPPLVGIEVLEKEEIIKKGITLFEIDATNSENTPEKVKPKFKEAVLNSEKYITDLYYDKTTIFNTYIGYQDMARSVIYEFRESYSMEKYNLKYDDLSLIQQKEIKKKYPLIISESGAFKPRN